MGHCLKIFDAFGNEIGTVQERVFSFLPKFEIYMGNDYIGCISKEFSFFTPRFNIDYNGWHVEGDFFEWDYNIYDMSGSCVAEVSKQLFNCCAIRTVMDFKYCISKSDAADGIRMDCLRYDRDIHI